MPAENFAIATNNVDKIAYGGADKKVITRQVVLQQTDAGRYSVKLEGDPYIGLLFNSAVKEIEFFGANKLLAISDDTSAQIVDLESGKMTNFLCGKYNCSV